ncbi:HSP20-like chaperone [Cantharellus anzutake]|uniref:HSP20-like chaperone n=1 Tax=Cantharellus anzutake TaxID=1750568 RepID=UPI0019031ACC|nr:HSP20-like chaperone [Cantharellus anzutake]KAF8334092.1 HSP20-like chaperone [Cantharellus anzutake]
MKSIASLRRVLLQQRAHVPRRQLIQLKQQKRTFGSNSGPLVIFDEFDRLFNQAFGRTALAPWVGEHFAAPLPRIWQPRLDLRENSDNTITAAFELPGLRKEDVSIELQGNLLTIRGEHSEEKVEEPSSKDSAQNGASSSTDGTQAPEKESKPKYILRERHYGSFSRTIPVPEGTNPESIKASVENGVLQGHLPEGET